jgi:hypothetical protein
MRPLYHSGVLIREKTICLIRDPREMLVSGYYSCAYSHGLSGETGIRARQIENRESALSMGINGFALAGFERLKPALERMRGILEHNPNAVPLRYEDMIDDFELFYARLQGVVSPRI